MYLRKCHVVGLPGRELQTKSNDGVRVCCWQLLNLNFKDAGAVTYLDKLPTVPAKAGSAAAAAVSPALGPLSSASLTRRSLASSAPAMQQSAGSISAGLPVTPQPQQGLAGGLGYVRMVPSKDLAVASSVCDESVEAVRVSKRVYSSTCTRRCPYGGLFSLYRLGSRDRNGRLAAASAAQYR